jgi:hypothetical protein
MMEMQCVSCEVGTEFLSITSIYKKFMLQNVKSVSRKGLHYSPHMQEVFPIVF